MSVYETIFCVLLSSAMVITLTTLLYERRTRISASPVMPWVATTALIRLGDLFAKNSESRIAELGCGWGGTLLALERLYPKCSIDGYELSPFPFALSWLRAIWRRRIQVRRQDFFTVDLSEYGVIFCYLSNWHMKQLKPQLSELKPGVLVVSCSFPIPGWSPVWQETIPGPIAVTIWIYETGPRIDNTDGRERPNRMADDPIDLSGLGPPTLNHSMEPVRCNCEPIEPDWEYIGCESYRCRRCGLESVDSDL